MEGLEIKIGLSLMSQKNSLTGGTLQGQTVEMGFAAGEFSLRSRGIGRGERRGGRGDGEQSGIKAPG